MGSYLGKQMSAQMEKQKEFMVENSALMTKRQLQMQNEMRERQMAIQISRSRELFTWLASFYVFALIGATHA